jgi:predicted phosphodiesterase
MNFISQRTRYATFLAVVICVLAGSLWAADQQKKGPQGGGQKGRAARQPSGDQFQAESFKTDVPARDIDIILARPTNNSVTLSVLAYRDMEAAISYGTSPQGYDRQVAKRKLEKGKPTNIVIGGLASDTQHYYRLREVASSPAARQSAVIEGTFHTQRGPGSSFVFTVTADPHLDQRADPDICKATLTNAASDRPDFHVDLGDTFMTEKHHTPDSALPQYLAQRYYFGQLCSSAPLFLVLGNHDGETLRELDGTAASLGLWATATRTQYFPCPIPDAFYTGNSLPDRFGGLPQDYYAWQWGDALFVVLDPYRFGTKRRGTDDNWSCSLGEVQHQWLKQTLEKSKARYRFVFIHQLVGAFTNNGRGGAEAASFFEWGGRNADGTDGFKANRPGWPEPIHQLFVRTGVSVVFHGHDHLFAKQDLDGIVYQEIPQPGSYSNLRNGRAAEYGYVNGTILGGSGHIRVTVSPQNAKVEYVASCLLKDASAVHPNGETAFSYTVAAKAPQQ